MLRQDPARRAGGVRRRTARGARLAGVARRLPRRAVDWPPSWPNFPGHVTYRQFVGDARPAPRCSTACARAVEARGIEVRYDTRVTELPEGNVVLAAGGFEYDEELRDTYLPLPLTAVGHPGNTGDAVRLAQQAGASLWHMSAFFGWFAFRHPDHVAAFPLDVHAPSFIYVDADGRRFADETGWEVHDKLRCLTTYLPRRRNRPRMPGYAGLRRARAAGRAAQRHRRHAQRLRLERRQLGRARRGLDPAGRPSRRVASSRSTLARVRHPARRVRPRAGDARPARAAAVRDPDAGPPWPPHRAARGATPSARVLQPDGTPIPGLYAAGAAGSIWGHLTEHGGGLTDAIVFGRVAGLGTASR